MDGDHRSLASTACEASGTLRVSNWDLARSRLAWQALEKLTREQRDVFHGPDGLQAYLTYLEKNIPDLPVPELAC